MQEPPPELPDTGAAGGEGVPFGPAADLVPCGLVRCDGAGLIRAANATILDWVGLEAAAVLGVKTLPQLMSHAAQIYWRTHLEPQLRLNGRIDEVALPLPDAAGGLRHCLVTGRVLPEGGATVFALFEAARRHRHEQDQARFGAMAQMRARWLAQLERMAGVGAWAYEPESGVIEASDRVFEILGLDPVAGLTVEDVLARVVSPKARALMRARIATLPDLRVPISFESAISTPAGTLRRIQLHAEAEWQKGRFTRVVGVLNDVTRRHEDQQRLWQAANLDDLTGLPNRRWFQRRLQAAIGTGQPLALVLLDLDDFTAVNDVIGVAAADALLGEVAGRLSGLVGTRGTAARLAGDEFALLLPDPAPDAAAERLAEAATEALGLPFAAVGGSGLAISAAIGMATLPTDAEDAEGLVRCARQALAEVKQLRQTAAAFLRGPMRSRFEARRAAIAFVQEAAREGRIIAHYQPKVRLDTRRLAGYEALARIRAVDGTVTGPEVWGAALDDIDCARLVDASVLDAVLGDLVIDTPRLIRVGVNFSEPSLRGFDFAEQILALIEARGLSPALIELEVVETVLVGQRMEPLAQGFTRLRAAGMRIALDDFGTGFASLSHLRDLPVDRIKLDKSFVLGLGEDPRNAPILRAIVDLASVLGFETVAEGIETEAAVVFLRGLGCREGQGFRFGAARPFDALPAAPDPTKTSGKKKAFLPWRKR